MLHAYIYISLLRFYLSFSREFLQTGLRKKQQSMLAKEIIVFFNVCNFINSGGEEEEIDRCVSFFIIISFFIIFLSFFSGSRKVGFVGSFEIPLTFAPKRAELLPL